MLRYVAALFRYHAAQSASLVGCRLGGDGLKLGEAERKRWRKQARDWLQADLAVQATMLAGGSRTDSVLVRQMLKRWQSDPDLAGLREPGSLEQWPTDERKECLALWTEVGNLLKRARDDK